MKSTAKLRQAVLLRAREVYMRSIGRSVLAVFFLLLQQVLCVLFSSGVATKVGEASTFNISGYPVNWLNYVLFFVLNALFGPIMLGVSEYFLIMLRTRNGRVVNIFNWFSEPSKLRRGLNFGLYHSSVTVIINLICEIPAVVLFKAGYSLTDMNTLLTESLTPNPAAVTLSVMTTVISLILQIPLLYLLATEYIMIDSPSKGIFQAIHESVRLMKGHIWSYVLMVLRILPLLFLISGCGFLIIFGYGFYYMIRSAYVDVLLIQSYISEAGYSPGGTTPKDVTPLDDKPPSEPPEE